MKSLKKIIALMSVAAMVVSTAVTASASFSGITVTQSAEKVAAGETVKISATFDTLVNAKGMEIEFAYDDTAFSLDTANNTNYNFGTSKKPVYYPNYIDDELISKCLDEMAIFSAWGKTSLSYNNYANGVKLLATDTSSGYVIADGDEAEGMYPYKTVGINFIANGDIAAGTYTFTITAKVSDATAGVVTSIKTATVTVEGATDPDPTPSVTEAVAGKTIENGYKTFSAPAPAVLATSAENLITVTKSGDTERKLTHALPAGVAGGKTKVLPIVSYKLGVNGVNAADVFTITITSGSDTIATYTYTAQ